jgi:nucleotide-binding universal stress UspA family protein
VTVTHRLAEGDPAKEIVREAQELNCDLVVLGTQGRTGLRRVLLGSVADKVLRRATCPVVTVGPAAGNAPQTPAGEGVRANRTQP